MADEAVEAAIDAISEAGFSIAPTDRLTSRDRQAEGLSEQQRSEVEEMRSSWPHQTRAGGGYGAASDVHRAIAILDAHFPPPAPTPVLREEAGE